MAIKEKLKSFFKKIFHIPQNMEESKGRDESIIFENIRRLRQYGHTPAPFLINNELDFFTEFEYESESLRGNQIRYILSQTRKLVVIKIFLLNIFRHKI